MRNDLGIPAIARRVRGGGVLRKRVLVRGDADNDVRAPGEANAGSLVGVTLDDAEEGRGVSLQPSGFAEIESAGAIHYGAKVNVADAGGRVKAVSEAAGETVNLVGICEISTTGAGQTATVDIRQIGATEEVPAAV